MRVLGVIFAFIGLVLLWLLPPAILVTVVVLVLRALGVHI